jgi:hypothetical protein
MTDVARRYQPGYRNPGTETWTPGVTDDEDADPGYYDIELEVWVDLPEDAILATDNECPDDYPIKGNLPSHVYHMPDQPSYQRTIPEVCFADEDAAMSAGFRPSQVGRRED